MPPAQTLTVAPGEPPAELYARPVTARASRPLGTVTRGTTNPNRLRRVDRWLAGAQGARLRRAGDPLVVDLGYGASGITAAELRDRLRAVRGDVEVVGIEIDPERVAAAQPLAGPGLAFVRGGFELPVPGGRRPVLVRAFNVLRQYREDEVDAAWAVMTGRLAPGGLLVEGTCDEVGRRAAWVALEAAGPVSLTLSLRLAGLERPSDVAERLPKVLIHRNVPGERVHAFLSALDDAWARQAPLAALGARQRWSASVTALRTAGWPVLDRAARWRLGEVTVAWDAVRPRAAG
jgi:hypothetical protein